MDNRRVWFTSAVAFFVAWVFCLSVLAVGWGRRPVQKQPAAAAPGDGAAANAK
jgi:hypothetical protein